MILRTPSYRLHKPSGQAVVTLDGHDVYLGTFGTPASKAEYDRLVAEWLANGRHLPSALNDLTINELLVRYYDFVDSYYRKPDGTPTTEAASIRANMKPLIKLFGHTLAKDFGPLALKATREKMIGSDLCRNEVNKRTRRIVRLFKWAVENELVPSTVHYGLRAVSGLKRGRSAARESEPVKPVPEAFVDAVLPHVLPPIRTMIELQRLTGMRPGEVCCIRGCDLDISGKVWVFRPASHKTAHHGHARLIFIGPRAQNFLRPWLKPDLQAPLFNPREAVEVLFAERRRNRKSAMTPSQKKRQRKRDPKRKPREEYDVRAYYHAIKRACVKAGVPHWHPHQLRHNAATWLRKEFGLDVARCVLGHRSAAVTEGYAEMDFVKAAEAMGRVG